MDIVNNELKMRRIDMGNNKEEKKTVLTKKGFHEMLKKASQPIKKSEKEKS